MAVWNSPAETPEEWSFPRVFNHNPKWHPWLIGKDLDPGRDWGQEEERMTEGEMAGWHHWLDGCESEWTPGHVDGQGGQVCCDSWGRKELDTTERLNWTELKDASASQVVLVVKKLPANARDVWDAGLIPRLGRFPEGWHSNPLQYSYLENPMDREAWWPMAHRVAECLTLLKWLRTCTQSNSTTSNHILWEYNLNQ